jgi:hypothetical protein
VTDPAHLLAQASARRAAMRQLRAQGMTLADIARKYAISSARVSQLLKRPEPSPALPPGPSPLSDLAVRRLFVLVAEMPSTARQYNALKRTGLRLVGDLATKTRRWCREQRGIGPTVLAEIEETLDEYELALGLVIPGWPATLPTASGWRRHVNLGGDEQETDLYDAGRLREILRVPKA